MTGEEFSEGLEPPRALSLAREVIGQAFAVASLARWLPLRRHRQWRAALQQRGMQLSGRRSFWLRLLGARQLFDLSAGCARPTILLAQWLEKPLFQQVRELVNAWSAQPASLADRRLRQRILRKLKESKGNPVLTRTETREAEGLRRLGLISGGLTPLGRVILQETAEDSLLPEEITPWQVEPYTLQAWPQEDFSLLWELEQFLLPYAPNQYLLTPAALRAASQRGSLEQLVSVIERGTERPLEPEIAARIRGTPAARLLPGQVLEFDSPEELSALRRSPSLRRRLDPLLSPRHVLLAPYQAEEALKALGRAGIPLFPRQPAPDQGGASAAPAPAGAVAATPSIPALHAGEIAYLYSLALAALELNLMTGPSQELISKLERMLPEKVRSAAQAKSRQAVCAQGKHASSPWRLPDDDGGAVPPGRVEALQAAAERGDTLPIWYRAAGRAAWERRRLTPLLIEQRGIHLFLLAYCHERRANRTFRLDRLLLESERCQGSDP